MKTTTDRDDIIQEMRELADDDDVSPEEKAIKLKILVEICKVKGYYAPTKSLRVTGSLEQAMKMVSEAEKRLDLSYNKQSKTIIEADYIGPIDVDEEEQGADRRPTEVLELSDETDVLADPKRDVQEEKRRVKSAVSPASAKRRRHRSKRTPD
jgi:hypothetical protein